MRDFWDEYLLYRDIRLSRMLISGKSIVEKNLNLFLFLQIVGFIPDTDCSFNRWDPISCTSSIYAMINRIGTSEPSGYADPLGNR